MKTLALVLLLTLPMMAQGQDTTRHYRPIGEYLQRGTYLRIDPTPTYVFKEDSICVIAGGDTVRTRGNYMLIGMTMLLLSKWDAYKAECYADSTQAFCEEGGIYHSCLVYGCTQRWDVPPTKVFDHWEHREPTFHGFMEYLRRKD